MILLFIAYLHIVYILFTYCLHIVYLHEASRMNIVCNVVCTNVARDAKKAIRCSSNWNKSIVNYKYLKFFENSNKSAVLENVETYQNLILLSIMYYVNKKLQKTRKYKNLIIVCCIKFKLSLTKAPNTRDCHCNFKWRSI